MKIWAYIEAHHEEYGVALFVLPVLLFHAFPRWMPSGARHGPFG